MNDHIAQFVKGAHILTAAAVVFLLFAAIPTSFVFSNQPPSPSMEVKVMGPVNVTSSELAALRSEVANLRKDMAAQGNCKAEADRLKVLEAEVAQLETKLKTRVPIAPSTKKRD